MFSTLLILLWQKKKKREIPHPINSVPESGGCMLTTIARPQIECTAPQHQQDGKKRRKAVPTLFSLTSLTWDAITSLEPGQA